MGRKWENRADPHWSDVDMGSRMTPSHPVTEDHRDGCQELLGAAVLLDPHQQLSHTGTAARHQPDRTLLPTCFRLKLDARLRAASPASSQTTSPSMLHALGGAGRATGSIQWTRAMLGCGRRGGRVAREPRAVREFRTAREERRLGLGRGGGTGSCGCFWGCCVSFCFLLFFFLGSELWGAFPSRFRPALRPPPFWQAAAGFSRSLSEEFVRCGLSVVPPRGAFPGQQGEESGGFQLPQFPRGLCCSHLRRQGLNGFPSCLFF